MKLHAFIAKLMPVAFALLASCSDRPSMEDLMNVDRNFSQLSQEQGMNAAFLEYIADDGVVLRANARPFIGKQTVAELLTRNDDSTFGLTWEPLAGMISESGDLGFTYGIYTLSAQESESQGTYVTVWKKDHEGNWKFVLDTGNEGLGD